MNVGDINAGPSSPYQPARSRRASSPGGDVPDRQPPMEEQRAGSAAAPASAVRAPAVLTQEEGEFFERAYPESASEIRLRHSYSPTGRTAGAVTGTLIDRRG
jgi:hypothetical protein